MIITAKPMCVCSVFIICCSDCLQLRHKWDKTLAWGPRRGKVQRQMLGVEYLLQVACKVDNQQTHKSQKLNFVRAMQAVPQSFIHLLLSLLLYSCPQNVLYTFLFVCFLGLLTYPTLSQLLLNRQEWIYWGLCPAGLADMALVCLPHFFDVAVHFCGVSRLW